ncbi:MAG TPA: hypothetical protein VNT54_00410 [Solirubrobacteraceae bacterium]|nr:hypothetical protein [Solirubrobacteraceae bacterium]
MSTRSETLRRASRRTATSIFGMIAVAAIAWSQAASAAPKDKAGVVDAVSQEQVGAAFSMLGRTASGITTKVRTRVRPGRAHTLWYVIFNAPEHCSDAVCGQDDIFADPRNHAAGFNAAQIPATRASVVSGSAGAVSNGSGRLKLDGGLAVGEVPAGPKRVVIGRGADGALVPLGVVTGLEDAARAVIIVVLQDHGRAHRDPALLQQQLTSFEGACNPVCADAQFAVHAP